MQTLNYLLPVRTYSLSCARWKSSKEWITRHVKDPYVVKASKESYRARSAYKLLEMNKKVKLLRPGQTVIECGAAPGAWTQVATSIVGSSGLVVACDLLEFEPVDGAIVLPERDFTVKSTQDEIKNIVGEKPIDVILSDMAPNVSGNPTMDHDAITNLVYEVLKFARVNASKDSCVFVKMFNGPNKVRLLHDLELCYQRVKIFKPPSSRKESSEFFIYAQSMKDIKKKSP